MLERMPKVPANFAPQITEEVKVSASNSDQPIITVPQIALLRT